MKLKDQVCSLKLAKQLKKLGVKQESLWYWYCDEEADDTDILNRDEKYVVGGVGLFTHKYSAFTVAELFDLMPEYTSLMKYPKSMELGKYRADKNEDWKSRRWDDNPVNSLAKMLIYLIENKLIKV